MLLDFLQFCIGSQGRSVRSVTRHGFYEVGDWPRYPVEDLERSLRMLSNHTELRVRQDSWLAECLYWHGNLPDVVECGSDSDALDSLLFEVKPTRDSHN